MLKYTGSLNSARLLELFGLLAFLLMSSIAASEEYPSKPLTVVVGFGVGGSADRMARSMSTFLATELGQPVR